MPRKERFIMMQNPTLIYTVIGSGLGDHLWQSTLFAITAGLFAVLLKADYARVRYCVWLAASAKFLFPFALLPILGSCIPWPAVQPETKARFGLYLAIESLPIICGSVNATQAPGGSQAQDTTVPEHLYEVVSIKPNKSSDLVVSQTRTPNGFTGTNVTLKMLLRDAYGVEDNRISGDPPWADSAKYDIEGKMTSATADDLRKLDDVQSELERQHMLQAILMDRFKLRFHRETKELPIYALVVGKNGPRLHEATPGDPYPNGIKGPDGVARAGYMSMGNGVLISQGLTMESVARLLTSQLGRTVVDNSGLRGKYDFSLKWNPDDNGVSEAVGKPGVGGTFSGDSSRVSIFTAIQEQLGLKLESKKAPVEIFVVDHVERPSEN
jgi:uncharacterized protein (TIGR03435 family)